MNVIVKKSASHSIFKPHYNTSMGKFYHTKSDYMGDIKKHNLEPYRNVEAPKSKPLEMTREGRDMCRQAAAYEKRGEKPGSRFQEAYAKLGVAKAPKWANTSKGGFHSE
jgi:hypothetical protein